MSTNPVLPEARAPPADAASIEPRVLAICRELARELHPHKADIDALGPEASLERGFGLDSLARVELGLRIESLLGTALPENALAEAESVRDLARALVPSGLPPTARVSAPRVQLERAAAAAPAAPATLLDALEWHVREHPQRTHILLVDSAAGPERITFAGLQESAIAVAAGLVHRGVRPGESVAIMLPTGREFFVAFYGALYAHAVPVPLYPPARPSQIEAHLRRLAGILANCEARVLITFTEARRLAQLLRSLRTHLETIATVPEIAAPPRGWHAPPVTAQDTAFLQYTSGSTGQPKGVVLTHANLLANLAAMQRATGVASSDCFVSWLPLYHDMGLIGACLGALVMGFPLVLMSPFAFLARPVRWLRAIHEHQATLTAAPNFAFELCLGRIEQRELVDLNLASLRMAFNGAEAVSPHTVERFAAQFARYGLRREALMPVYGLAECALGLTFPPQGRGPQIDRVAREPFLHRGTATAAASSDPAPLSFVSCGAVLPGHRIRIVDPTGNAVRERVQGRIEFQGPSATRGYFRNERDTARLFDGEWLDTGDLGYLADGELYVTGRAKDIIIRGGQHVHPQELEEAVGQLPGVRKGGVAVFPASDRRAGTERIVVLAETREANQATREALIRDINRLAVDLIGLPVDEVMLASPRTVLKTSSGKIRRAACREAYERGELGARTRPPWVQLARLGWHALGLRVSSTAHRGYEIAWGVRALLVAAALAPWLWLSILATPGLARRRRLAARFARAVVKLCGVRVQVHPAARAATGPTVYVTNHASYVDSLILLPALPPDVAFVAKREFAGTQALGRLFERLGCVFVERHELREAAAGARELQSRLEAGESLVVFAEGTFQREPGLLPFHLGAFAAAAGAGAVVVPVAICGTRSLLPDGKRLPCPVPIEVVVGEPLPATEAGWHAVLGLREAARTHILRHVGEPDLEQGAAAVSA